jgi:hypothetical protein
MVSADWHPARGNSLGIVPVFPRPGRRTSSFTGAFPMPRLYGRGRSDLGYFFPSKSAAHHAALAKEVSRA